MVGRMPKKVQADQLASEYADVPESPEQRRRRLSQAQQTAMTAQSRIAEHDAREEARMYALSRRAKQQMLSLEDLMGGDSGPALSRQDVMLPDMQTGQQFLTEDFPTNHDDVIMEEMYRPPTRPIRQPQQQPARPRQQLTEQRPIRSSEPAVSENWRAKRYLGETRSGAEVQVWKVENTKTGSSLRNLFRIEGVASRIAMMLNESGDINDPRVISLAGAYEKRDKLLKEARQLEREAEGKPMKTQRLRQIRAEINQLDYRLGV